MKNLKRIFALSMVLSSLFSIGVNAASYDAVEGKFYGYGVSVTTKKDHVIEKKTVSEVENKKNYAITSTDTFSFKKNITFSASCASTISASIGATNGTVSGDLGAELSTKYSFSSNFVRSYTKKLSYTVKAKNTCKVIAKIKGDKVDMYYKFFVCWIPTSKGTGISYVPKYCAWEVS